MGGMEALIKPVVDFFVANAGAITAGTTVAKAGYDVVAGNTARQEGKAAADEAMDAQEQDLLRQLRASGTSDKIVGSADYMTDPVLSSLLGGGTPGSSSTDLLVQLLGSDSKGGKKDGLL